MEISIPKVFVKSSEADGSSIAPSEEWFKDKEENILAKLKDLYPHIKFNVYEIRNSKDVSEFLEKESNTRRSIWRSLDYLLGRDGRQFLEIMTIGK